MDFKTLLDGYAPYEGIVKNLTDTPISVSGVVDTARPQLIAALASHNDGNTLVVTYSDMESKALRDDLRMYHNDIMLFPSKEYVFYNIEAMGHENDNARLSVLDAISSRKGVIVIASVTALMTYTADKKRFKESVISLEVGSVCDISDLTDRLVAMGYKREEIIEGRGQFAVRGGIVDVYTPNMDNPVRIELWDDEVDSLRQFDTDSQRTIENIESVRIIPMVEAIYTSKRREEIILELERRVKAASGKKNTHPEYTENLNRDIEAFREKHWFPSIDKYISLIYGKIPSLLDYFDKDDLAFAIDPKRLSERIKTYEWERGETVSQLKENGIIGTDKPEYYKGKAEIVSELSKLRLIAPEILSHTKNDFLFKRLESFTTKTTVSFHGKPEYLYDEIEKWKAAGYTVIVIASSRTRMENLCGVLNERGINARISENGSFEKAEIIIIKGKQKGGYEYPEMKIAVVSENEIYETSSAKKRRKNENAKMIKSYNDLSPGDYVVHINHGVGEYMGIVKMKIDNVFKDYIKLRYRCGGVLYIPIDSLGSIYKYAGKSDDKTVKLNSLGGTDWSRTKKRVKESTDELAQALIKLYAERENSVGYAFSEDTPWQKDFEDTFIYNETPDQLQSIEEVKADMEKPRPMDRLLCGDVGFGKTEVALRAAFKAVCDSKQVAYLCPTTILSMQHYETFISRMADFPITIEMLSRFRTPKQQKEILKKLKDGRIDIIIGTHRLLSQDVEFKDLGLLIVDEEQRFGVAHKERLKELKNNVDVLTMTATPIPRTLHMAMTSVRDMSVLANPPINRYPVQTYVLEFNPVIILDAIRNELSRGGQVFYLYNRVQGIYKKAKWLQEQFPDVNVAVGHGKLGENELEDIMVDMVNGDTQILVCTTIIETGLDIPNANTIIIENADRMGLAQLYQLRGRVGRSNRAAYAYLTYQKDKVLTEVSQKRLSAIREFTEFGSGFKLAMRDLEIRGAGNILGGEQHGHMDAVGYDMYCKILKDSINEAKGIDEVQAEDVSIDVAVNAYIPESYINSVNQRIDMYKKIAAVESEDDISEIKDELIDRYGEIPMAVNNIVAVAAIKVPARAVGCVEIKEREKTVTLKFREGKLTPQIIMGLDGKYRGRIKYIGAGGPSLRVNMLAKDKNTLEFINNLLILIKELQN